MRYKRRNVLGIPGCPVHWKPPHSTGAEAARTEVGPAAGQAGRVLPVVPPRRSTGRQGQAATSSQAGRRRRRSARGSTPDSAPCVAPEPRAWSGRSQAARHTCLPGARARGLKGPPRPVRLPSEPQSPHLASIPLWLRLSSFFSPRLPSGPLPAADSDQC